MKSMDNGIQSPAMVGLARCFVSAWFFFATSGMLFLARARKAGHARIEGGMREVGGGGWERVKEDLRERS